MILLNNTPGSIIQAYCLWLAVAAATALLVLITHAGTVALTALLATFLAALVHTGTATLSLLALSAGLLALFRLITTVCLLSTLVTLLATLVSVCVCHSS